MLFDQGVHRVIRKGLLVLLLAFTGSVGAHTGGVCNPVTLKPFTEHPPMYPYEMDTFRGLGKRWSTSSELKAYFDQQKQLLKRVQELSPPISAASALKLASVGDIMRLSADQDELVNPALQEYLDSVDILTGNLETLISPNYPVPPDDLFLMNSAPSIITGFRNQNQQNYFSVLSTANNHTFDFPDDAIKDTVNLLRKEGIFQSGIRESRNQKPYLVLEKNGIRIGYYAVTTFVNNKKAHIDSELHLNPIITGIEPEAFSDWRDSCKIDLSSTARVLKQMERDGADIKIISIHWGIEDDMYPQPVQLELAHRMVQQGADVIVGSHPHVPQPAEICFVNGYEEKLGAEMAQRQRQQGCVIKSSDGKVRKAMIYYSLGNFSSYTPLFWEQVGVIAEMQVARVPHADGFVVDWFAPEYVFTYDYVDGPPHGKRDINLLNTFIARRCGGSGCSGSTLNMVSVLKRHLTGSSMSWWEELKVTAVTTYDALKNLIYWQFFAPSKSP